ncbi:DUF5606 family protein [Aureibacter tunicatorum]|uniref:DUF5606 domain-containing protein n=1 Tax=Aureibacter tunicatorum TaxID=866807 RepID=A0AAE4BTZ3_9BACT|nr:DUF5606 domain-containing protein [Aureibacter tunicatorum]MDR6240177.1 hypothetical protein [Aureibacter tunicatorum]BDD05942.1 hypothetical protein AUTU_34250 [Aureibacter tunicatorum]
MNLAEVASISGKGGLFRIVSPTRSGVIVESLDGKKSRFVANSNSRVSILKEISIYTHDEDGSIPLEDVFAKIFDEFGADPGVGSTSSNEELRSFMLHILPDHDQERVYFSDIKKLVSWYKILLNIDAEAFVKKAEDNEASEESEEESN